jgi:hypothetical protein
MFRSKLMAVLAFSAIVSVGACAGGDDAEVADTATSTVPPAPMPMDTGMRMDTGMMDTTKTDTLTPGATTNPTTP